MTSQRSSQIALAGFAAASLLLHAAVLTPPGATLVIAPSVARCHAGEAIRLHSTLRTGARESPVNSGVEWLVLRGGLRPLGGNLFRCQTEGTALVLARLGQLESERVVDVGPPVMMLEAPPALPPQPPPPPRAQPRPVRPSLARTIPAAITPPPWEEQEERASEPAAAAPAAEVLTAERPSAEAPDDTAVTAPGSDGARTGVVAARGTASDGARGARPDRLAGGTGAFPAVAVRPGPDLSRPPALTDSDPCRGYFPDDASADEAVVELDVDVAADGQVRRASIRAEAPAQQGFGGAARRCFSAMRLAPARDRTGRATAGRMSLRFRFAR